MFKFEYAILNKYADRLVILNLDDVIKMSTDEKTEIAA